RGEHEQHDDHHGDRTPDTPHGWPPGVKPWTMPSTYESNQRPLPTTLANACTNGTTACIERSRLVLLRCSRVTTSASWRSAGASLVLLSATRPESWMDRSLVDTSRRWIASRRLVASSSNL